MNIAFDATAILGPMSKNRGIGNYALSQFTKMIDRDKNNTYFFMNMIEKDFSLAGYVKDDAVFHEDFIDTGKNNVLLRSEKYADIIGSVIKRYIEENNIDIFYITSPFESNYIAYKKEWFGRAKVVVTVYDIIPYVMKENYLADKTTYKWYMSCIDNLRWADEIFVISESVKTDMIEHLGFNAENIHVIWGAVDKQYEKLTISEEDKSALMKKFGVKGEFIMCTGGEDGRKNLDGLIRSYSLLPAELKNKYQLVVVCKLSENGMSKLSDVAKKSGVSGNVIFTNFVTAEELVMFYNLASLMAFPSKYEGFGLPIVEAWACGTPVLTSNNSSLCQIGGDAVMLVDADSDKSIAAGMEKALQPEMLAELAEKGEKRLELYRWDRVADIAIEFLNQIKTAPAAEKRKEAGREKIAFFTPLPPVESGISDYSEDIINALSAYLDIDVFIDDGYTPSCKFPESVNIFNHSEYTKKQSQYFDTVYQMGNSEYHFYMYPYVQKYSGTLVLHDYNMHGALYHYAMSKNKGNYQLYRKCLLEDFDAAKVDSYIQAQKNGSANPAIYEMETNGVATNYAHKLIVHSGESKYKLLAKNIKRNVEVIASYAVIDKLPDAEQIKVNNGFAKDTVIISAFGGIHETKRAVPILKAFAKLRKECENVHLLFAGKLADSIKDEFEKIISANNISEAVTVTGYIDLDKFKEYIDMTDICLNLRYPSNGETSGSLMRILAKGKCVVVNEIGSFAEIPDEICVKLPPANVTGESREADIIFSTMKELIEDADKRNSLGQAARKFAEENLDINIVAKHYYDYIMSEATQSPVSEEIIREIRNDERFCRSDAEGIAETLAYAKGISVYE